MGVEKGCLEGDTFEERGVENGGCFFFEIGGAAALK